MAKWSILLGVVLGAVSIPGAAQTLADDAITLDAQYQLMMKRKQLQDLQGPDPILYKVPQVVSVFSFGDQIKAKLMLANGVALTYGEGEVINQRMRVVAITPREVVVAITPSEPGPAKGKKAKAPVLMPLDFLAGSRQMQAMAPGGLPGVPGTPVSAGPIPPGLLQAPPAIAGGSLANWPQAQPQPAVAAATAQPAAASQPLQPTATPAPAAPN